MVQTSCCRLANSWQDNGEPARLPTEYGPCTFTLASSSFLVYVKLRFLVPCRPGSLSTEVPGPLHRACWQNSGHKSTMHLLHCYTCIRHRRKHPSECSLCFRQHGEWNTKPLGRDHHAKWENQFWFCIKIAQFSAGAAVPRGIRRCPSAGY